MPVPAGSTDLPQSARLGTATATRHQALTRKRGDDMPRYYFHYRTETDLIRDEAGSEHADLDAAERSAAEMGRAIMERIVGEGGEVDTPRSIEITDEEGHDLLYVVFWAGPDVDDGYGTPIDPVTVH